MIACSGIRVVIYRNSFGLEERSTAANHWRLQKTASASHGLEQLWRAMEVLEASLLRIMHQQHANAPSYTTWSAYFPSKATAKDVGILSFLSPFL